jgi:hypothetical protein
MNDAAIGIGIGFLFMLSVSALVAAVHLGEIADALRGCGEACIIERMEK